MSGSLAAFTAGIDRLLTRGQNLFPASGGPGDVDDGGPGPPPPPAPAGGGQLQEAATGAGDDYERSRSAVSSLADDAAQATDDANAVGAQGRANSGAIRDTARAQAAAIGPATDSPAGVKLMVSTMDQRLGDMQRELDTANAQNRLIAARMRQVAAAYAGIGGMGAAPGGSGGFGGAPTGGVPGGGGLSGLSGLAGLPGTLMAHRGRTAGASNASGRNAVGAAGIAEGRIPLSSISFEGKNLWPGGQAAIRHYLDEALDRMGITDPQVRGRWTAGMMTIADHESTFRADAINLGDSNAHGPQQIDGGPLHATRGPWQVMPDTFAANHQPGTSNHIWDPVASACASMNYQMSRYGVARDAGNLHAVVTQANPGVHHAY